MPIFKRKALEHHFMSSRLNAAAPLTCGQRGPLGPTRSRACGAAHRNLFPCTPNHGKGTRSRRLRKADRPSPPMRRARAGQIIEDDRCGRERKQIKPDCLSKKSNNFLGSRQNPASQFCSLPTWWSWRGDHTRSHPEHGRETPLRQWYFVSRRGRVGHRQVRKTQNLLAMDDPNPTNISTALR